MGRDTVRQALALLRSEGLISSRRGQASHIRSLDVRTVRLRRGSATIRVATDVERRQLGLAEGDLVVVVSRPGQEDEVLPALGTTLRP